MSTPSRSSVVLSLVLSLWPLAAVGCGASAEPPDEREARADVTPARDGAADDADPGSTGDETPAAGAGQIDNGHGAPIFRTGGPVKDAPSVPTARVGGAVHGTTASRGGDSPAGARAARSTVAPVTPS